MSAPSSILRATRRLAYETLGSVGLDVAALITAPEGAPPEDAKVEIQPGTVMKIYTGLRLQCMSNDTYMKLETRSSMAAKGIIVVGGIIDKDYRGEIIVALNNTSKVPYVVRNGDRIAQLIPTKIERVHVQVVDESVLDPTSRGSGGFGSTGV